MQQVNLIGRMVRDAEDLPGGKGGVKFSLAVEYYNFSSKSRETNFWDCVAFGDVTTVIKGYAPKGKPVRVTGELQKRKYTASKGPHAGHEVEQVTIRVDGRDGFELLPGTSPAKASDEDDEDDDPLW